MGAGGGDDGIQQAAAVLVVGSKELCVAGLTGTPPPYLGALVLPHRAAPEPTRLAYWQHAGAGMK